MYNLSMTMERRGEDLGVSSNRLREALRLRNMTPADLARETGVSNATISLILTGKRSATTAAIVAKMARALSVSSDYLLELSDEAKPTPLMLGDLPLELAQMARRLPGPRQRDLIAMARTYMQMYAQQDLAQFQEDVLDLVEQYGGKEDRDQLVALLEGMEGGIAELLLGDQSKQ